jgi:hypothetical protein
MISEQIIDTNSHGISINGDLNIPLFLEQKEINQSHKTLGAFKSIIGKATDHIQHLMEKVKI